MFLHVVLLFTLLSTLSCQAMSHTPSTLSVEISQCHLAICKLQCKIKKIESDIEQISYSKEASACVRQELWQIAGIQCVEKDLNVSHKEQYEDRKITFDRLLSNAIYTSCCATMNLANARLAAINELSLEQWRLKYLNKQAMIIQKQNG